MKSSREQLLKQEVLSEVVTVHGVEYLVVGTSMGGRGELFSKARKADGTIDSTKLESVMLAACVIDHDDKQPLLNREQWTGVPSHITGPLFSHVMRVTGLDKEDVGKAKKDSDATES